MNTEHKITYQDHSMCCHDDLIEEHFDTVDGFKQRFAEEWGCTVEELTYEGIDLAPVEAERKCAAEHAKAQAFSQSIIDDDLRAFALNKKIDAQRGLVSWENPGFAMIDTLEAAVVAIWPQYYDNKARIEAGDAPIEYTKPDGLPTAMDINVAFGVMAA